MSRERRVRPTAAMRDVLELCDPDGGRLGIVAPEDADVRALCERIGYGAVMDSAARQWRRKDPAGAFTVGPCVVSVRRALGRRAPGAEEG